MISSAANPAVKEVVLLQTKARARCESGLFVVEGLRLVREVPADQLVRAYATERFAGSEEGRTLCEKLKAETVSDAVMEKMGDTKTPQGILAIVRQKRQGIEDFGEGPLLILERVQDPGNLGTLFRTAEAAGAGGILMDGETADVYQPKVVRSTMGAVFRVPFAVSRDLRADAGKLKTLGYTLYAAHLKGSEDYDRIAYPAKAAYLLGNEGNGLTEALTACADGRLRIPMLGRTESLNVSVAGALLLYEHFRQRRNG